MNTTWSSIEGFVVETESGMDIGRVHDCMFDMVSFEITHFEVKHGHLTQKKMLLVHVSQIVRITETKIIVRDSAVKKETEKTRSKKTSAMPAGASATNTNL